MDKGMDTYFFHLPDDFPYRIKNLLRACANGDIATVKEISEEPFFVFHRSKCLCIAAKGGRFEVVKYLIEEAKADANVCDKSGQTPIHLASRWGHLELVKYLIKEVKANADVCNSSGQTPLHCASQGGYLQVIKYLIEEANAETNVYDHIKQTPLHLASQEGHIQVIKYLIEEVKADVAVRNSTEETPLHLASQWGHLEVVKYLIEESKASVRVCESSGQTPLHLASRRGDLKLVKYLIEEAKASVTVHDNSDRTPLHWASLSGDLEVVKCLMDAKADATVSDNNGCTPLHEASQNGQLIVVKYLIEKIKANAQACNNSGQTPLHLASLRGNLEVVKYLIEEAKAERNVCNKDGWTPLHNACIARTADVVEYLLNKCHCNPNCTTNDGRTPLALAQTTSVIQVLLKNGALAENMLKYSYFFSPDVHRVQPRATLFMVGERGAGKSTLTAALKVEKKGIARLVAYLSRVGGVKEMTAGIESHFVDSPRLGSLIIYDLAGHYEYLSTHDTVIRSVMSGCESGMVFLLVKLNDNEEKLRQTTTFWLCFLENLLALNVSLPSTSRPSKLLAVGSHADMVTWTDLQSKQVIVETLCKSASKLQFVGFVALNCQYSESPAMTQVREHILNLQIAERENMKLTFHLKCLHVFLVSVCGDQPGIQLREAMQQVNIQKYKECARASFHVHYLPQNPQAMNDACAELTRRGLILFLPRDPVEISWIIIERESLLRIVNGTVFAPESFDEHKTLAIHTGVVPLTKIHDCFQQLDTTKHIETELIVQFLCHMEFCQEIKDNQMLDMLAIHYPQDNQERYFLFPGLITEKVEDLLNVNGIQDLWQPSSHFSYSIYSSQWILQCHGEGQYLSPRFLQVLLLRLAFAHACPVAAHVGDPTNPVLQQACTLWKNGIKWSSTSSAEAMVEIDSRQVTLTLRCKEGEEKALVCLRSQVVSQILAAKKEFCYSTKTAEHLVISPTKATKLTVSVPNIAHSICKQQPAALANEHPYTPISLGDLLHFEPYMYFSPDCLSLLYSPESQSLPLTQQFIENACHLVVSDFCKVLNVHPHHVEASSSSSTDYHKAERMFTKWQSCTEGTFQCLRNYLDKYSLFSGRNIFEVADVPLPSIHLPPQPNDVDHPLSSKPTMQALQAFSLPGGRIVNLVGEIAFSWERVATQLKFSTAQIKKLQNNTANCYDPKGSACFKMLQDWLERDPDATWNILIRAILYGCEDLTVLASDIEAALK